MEGEKGWVTVFYGDTNRKQKWLIQRDRWTLGQTGRGGARVHQQRREEKEEEMDVGTKRPSPTMPAW